MTFLMHVGSCLRAGGRLLTGLALALTLAACGGETASPKKGLKKDMVADHIFQNGRIYTLEADMPWAAAVAVKGDRIVFVGDARAAADYIGPATEVHDLAGRVMMPGFIDTHAHPLAGGAYARALSLDTFAGPAAWIKAIGAYAEANPDLPLIFGYGFLASAFGETGPTREMLDAVVPDRPVFIMDEGFHAGWANSAAIERLGVTRDTPDPTPGFNYYKRDATGAPTGYFLEGTANMAMDKLKVFTRQSVAEGVNIIFDIMNGYGVTSVFDAGALDVEDMMPDVLRSLAQSGEFSVRLVGSHMVADPAQMAGALDRVAELAKTVKHDNYHIRMLKIMNDGTIEGRTAGMFVDYQGDPGNRGATVFSQQELTGMVVAAAERGIDVHIHALGERTIHEALNAIAAARAAHGDSESRYTICHIQVMTDAAVRRFAELDVITQSTPLWASYDSEGEKYVNADQFRRYFRYNSLKRQGVRLTFGSDFPASGAGTLGMSPLFNMEVGHTRQRAGAADDPVQPSADERLDMPSLIRGYTLDAAYQLHMEDQIGSIRTGKKADLIIVDQDPLEARPHDIHKIGVDLTMMDGRIVYRKD